MSWAQQDIPGLIPAGGGSHDDLHDALRNGNYGGAYATAFNDASPVHAVLHRQLRSGHAVWDWAPIGTTLGGRKR
jgi:hypothetical protein